MRTWLILLVLVGCTGLVGCKVESYWDYFHRGDRVINKTGRTGTIQDMRDVLFATQVLVSWDDLPKSPDWRDCFDIDKESVGYK